MIASCAVVSLASLANAENGASSVEPVIAMVVAAVTASRVALWPENVGRGSAPPETSKCLGAYFAISSPNR